MTKFSKTGVAMIALAAMAVPAATSAQQTGQDGDLVATVYGEAMPAGPDVEGVITARKGDRIQITAVDGTNTIVTVDEKTEVKAKGGFLGLGKKALGIDSLLNGIPVKVETLQSAEGLFASEIRFKKDDLEQAAMIRNATSQRFAEHRTDIDANSAAAEALRGRMANIDQYDIMGSTNVYFDTGKWNLDGEDRAKICDAAAQAQTNENALLLVVGYTDSVGSQDYNQILSERRAGRVVNFLQQECGWKPWRMLTPTGMAEADPLADNSTEEGKAQNRRVSVNILVSKSVAGL